MVEISILLPTYNGARFIEEQVESILVQSFDNFELLIVDDGSSDNTVPLLDAIANRDPRIRRLPSCGNIGQKRRLNELAGAAKGQFIAVADQDDIWHIEKLSLLRSAITDKAMAFGSSHLIDAIGSKKGYTLLDSMPPAPSAGDRLIYLFKPVVSAHAALLRRPFFSLTSTQRALPFDWLQSLDASFGGGVAYVPEAVTMHRIHDSNQSNGHLGRKIRLRDIAKLSEALRYRRRKTASRWAFTGRLEHLANSSLIREQYKSIFQDALHLCMRAWFLYEPFTARDDLHSQLKELLLPLAANEAEGVRATYWITQLTTPTMHPNSIFEAWRTLRRRSCAT